MITIQFSGRLGNLLFQIASTIAYAITTNHAFSLEAAPLSAWRHTLFRELNPFIVESYEDATVSYNEQDAAKITTEPSPNDTVRLVGFFQDYRIFDGFHAQILSITGLSRRRAEVIESGKFDLRRGGDASGPVVSMHVRRGDYEDARCYHLLLNEYYYRNSVVNIASRYGSETKVRVVVFCEPGAKEIAVRIADAVKSTTDSLGYKVEYVQFDSLCESPVEDYEELLAMSSCDHHIIANSTFSWWAAYLNPAQQKIVCYPDQFYNHQLYYLSTDGLEMPGWTKISAWNSAEYKCGCYELLDKGLLFM